MARKFGNEFGAGGIVMLSLWIAVVIVSVKGCMVRFGSGGEVCGNGIKEEGETCDGTDFGGVGCSDVSSYEHGELTCTNDCKLDFSLCHTCGNNWIEGPEECDGTNVGGETCQSLGFDGGTLACRADCMDFDTSLCSGQPPACGNGVIEGNEVCDSTNLGGATCETQGFDGGTLACQADCMDFDTSECDNCVDNDGDGYGNPGSPVCPAGPETDCCDSDSNAYPGQTAYFFTPNNCGNWDYDCNGDEDKRPNTCEIFTDCQCMDLVTVYTNAGCNTEDTTHDYFLSKSDSGSYMQNCGESTDFTAWSYNGAAWIVDGDECVFGSHPTYYCGNTSRNCECK